MRTKRLGTLLIFVVMGAISMWLSHMIYGSYSEGVWILGVACILALALSSAFEIANQWDRAVVLRLGCFHALKGPGLFWSVPIIDRTAYWIDIRTISTLFKAEKTLTRDTVPVDVDAVLFWKVIDPKRAALEVVEYKNAVFWAAQTALRDVIGKTVLSDMLEGRGKIDNELQKIIDKRTTPWGVRVISVEIKDVLIPSELENAMSMQAQAERERQARVILGDSEYQIAEKFEKGLCYLY